MLISFSVENYLSYKGKTTFSMVASQEKQHQERCPFLNDYKLRLLPIAAIYGGNASGKTNLFKALDFARKLIIDGTKPNSFTGVEPYRLETAKRAKPSSFIFELYLNGKCYEYGFNLTNEEIVEEWLVIINKTTEKELFRRIGDKIEFAENLEKDQFLKFAFQGTRENQLFLTNSVQQKVLQFEIIYKWFRDSLLLIAPDTRFRSFENFMTESSKFNEFMNSSLSKLDTGIVRLGSEEISFENLPILDEVKNKINTDLQEGQTMRVEAVQNSDFYTVSRIKGELKIKKLVTYHQDSSGAEVKFEFRQESDGTKRVINLLPIFIELAVGGQSRCVIIDELDRSLHTQLTKFLIKNYLDKCTAETRNQLLLTTHDMMLMDQSLFRRDEMWVVERQDAGSELVSFSDFKEIRYDKDIRKSYLDGRLGGVPTLQVCEYGEDYQ